MKKSRYTDSQIISILKQAEAGTPVPDLCRKHGMSSATFYKWRAKYGGMDASLMARLKDLEDENRRQKKMYAEERLVSEIRKEALDGKWYGPLRAARGPEGVWNKAVSASAWRAGRSVSVRRATGIRRSSRKKTHGSPTG